MPARSHTIALAVAVAWMALAFAAASVAAEWGWATRVSALVQWLVAGVLPPALAMASLDPVERPARIGGWPPRY